MYISYDARVDALYIRLMPDHHQVTTKVIDDDIALDFDEEERLFGIEILDASRRLDLARLFPLEFTKLSKEAKLNHSKASQDNKDGNWDKLVRELERRKQSAIAIDTAVRHEKNWVEDVGLDYIVVRRDETGNKCTVTRSEFEGSDKESLRKKRKWAITRALRELASSL